VKESRICPLLISGFGGLRPAEFCGNMQSLTLIGDLVRAQLKNSSKSNYI
jgi:hypothetical protein